MFDLIAGTSTGGILGLGLTVPHSSDACRPKYKASQLVSFYEEDGKEVFHSFWQNVVSLRGLITEKYSSERFEAVLRKYMGDDTRLSEALTEMLITSYEIEKCRPFFFTRRKARARRTGRLNPRMWEVARCTSAAPTYFSPFQIKRPRSSHLPPLTFIDAGVFVNNPTLCAYVEAVGIHHRPVDLSSVDISPGGSRQSERPVEVRSDQANGSEEPEYVVLSLGTGELNSQIRYEEARRWGTIHWARPLDRHRLRRQQRHRRRPNAPALPRRQAAIPLLPLPAQPERSQQRTRRHQQVQHPRPQAACGNRSSTIPKNSRRSRTSAASCTAASPKQNQPPRNDPAPNQSSRMPESPARISWCRKPRARSRPRAAAPSSTSGSRHWC